MRWDMGALAPDGQITAYVIASSYSTVSSGTTLTTTFAFSSTLLSEVGVEASGLTADVGICGPGPGPGPGATATPTLTATATPTPTATATPTTTPTPPAVCYLPLVAWNW
jgi:hypothetical protein